MSLESGETLRAAIAAIDDVRSEVNELRAEQRQLRDQFLSGLQFLTDIVQMLPTKSPGSPRSPRSPRSQNKEFEPACTTQHDPPPVSSNDDSPPKDTEYMGSQGSKSHSVVLAEMPNWLQRKGGGTPQKSNDIHRWIDESGPISSEVGSPAIPNLADLERRMLRQTSSSHSLRPRRPRRASSARSARSARRSSGLSGSSNADGVPDGVLPVAPQHPPHQPNTPQPAPPPLQVSKLQTTSGCMLARRGSAFQNLTRDSQAKILTITNASDRDGLVCMIFVDNIGVSLWLHWSNTTTLVIVLMNLGYLVLILVLGILGMDQQFGEQWKALSLVLFSTVAVLLLQLVKRSLRSEDLNMAMQKLDEFVHDCGHGLDWGSVARKHWRRFVALWVVVLLAFVVQQVLEVYMANAEGASWSFDRQLILLKAGTSVCSFAVSSAVVMNGAYFQFNLLLGLGKTLDCWCSDILESQDFISGINTWNSLQALLKCVGRELTPCFTALNLLGYAGFFAALAGSFSLLLDDDLKGSVVALHETALLPFVYLFYLSARLFAKGAFLSEKCRQIPAFVNQLSGEGADADRQYLVHFISDSAAGFIVHGVTLSQSVFLKQMHFLTAVVSGFAGVLMRRYL